VWNIDPLLRQPRPPEPTPITFRLRASKGTLYFDDFLPDAPVRATLWADEFTLSQPRIGQMITLRGTSGALGAVEARAFSDGKRWLVEVNAEGVQGARFKPYLPRSAFDLEQATGRVSVQIRYEPSQTLRVLGTAEGVAQSATFRKKPLPFRAAQFQLAFTESQISGVLTSSDGRMQAQGSVDWSGRAVEVAAQIRASGDDAAVLWRLLRDDEPLTQGRYQAQVRLQGTVDSPQAYGVAAIERVRTPQGDLRNLRSSLAFSQGQLLLPNLKAEFVGRPVQGKLWLDTRPDTPEIRLHATVDRLPLQRVAALREYALSGEADMVLSAFGRVDAPTIEVNVLVDALRYANQRVGGLRARLHYANGALKVPLATLQGALGAMQVSGEILNIADEEPRLDLGIDASEVDLNLLAQLFGYEAGAVPNGAGESLRLDGVGYLTAQVRGSVKSPEAIAEMVVFDGRLGDIGAEIAVANLNLLEGEVRIAQLQILRRAAQLLASGAIQLPEPSEQPVRFSLNGDLYEFDLASVPDWLRRELPLAGLASGNFQLEGEPRQWTLRTRLNAESIQYDQTMIGENTAQLIVEAKDGAVQVQAESIQARLGDGMLTASGQWRSDGRFEAQWALENASLDVLAPYLPVEYRLSGQATVQGEAAGRLDAPSINLRLRGSQIALNNVLLGDIEAQVAVSPVAAADFTKSASSLVPPTPAPSPPLSRGERAGVRGDSRTAAFTNLARAVGMSPVPRADETNLPSPPSRRRGKARELIWVHGSGSLSSEQARLFALTPNPSPTRWERGAARQRFWSAEALASASSASFASALHNPPLPLAGEGDKGGEGKPARCFAPTTKGNIAPVPKTSYLTAVPLSGARKWGDSRSLHLTAQLTLRTPDGEATVDLQQYDLERQQVQLTAETTPLPIEWLRRVARAVPDLVPQAVAERIETLQGQVQASLSLTGALQEPTASLRLNAETLEWRGQPLGSVNLQAEWTGASDIRDLADAPDTTRAVEALRRLRTQQATLQQLRWQAETARLEARGVYTPERLTADVEIAQLPLRWARLWEPSLPAFDGNLDLSLLAAGAPESPELTLSATVNQLTYSDYTVDQILFSQIEVREGAIQTDDALIRMGDYQARLSGRLPFHWSPLSIPSDEPIQVSARLREQPLTLLGLFLPINPERTQGALEASLEVGGTLAEPQPRGYLQITNGALALQDLNTALQEIGLQVEFDGREARIVQAHAKSSEGGSLRVEGRVDLSGEKPTANLTLYADALTATEPKLPVLEGSAQAVVSGAVQVRGVLTEPLVQGAMRVPRGFLYLPPELPERTAGEPLPVNPRFDVRVAIADDFTLRNPNLDARLEGALQVGGTLHAPTLSGEFNLRGGVLRLPTARLRLEPDSVARLNYPFTGATGETLARIELDVRASTSVVAPDFTGDPIRYRVEVDVRGPLDDPERLQLTARSDPPGLSEQRILSLLGRGQALAAIARGADPAQIFREQLGDILTTQVLPGLFAPLETGIAETLDLEQFTLDYTGLRPASLYLVKNLFNGVGIAYRRGIGVAGNEYQARIFYRLPFRNRLLQRLRVGFGFEHTGNRFLFIEGSLLFR
jgi:autotransporter translocation and assembly factor TamB